MKDIIYNYEPLWGEWKVEKQISGSTGNVYRISRDLYGKNYYPQSNIMKTQEQYSSYIASTGSNSIDDRREYFKCCKRYIQ